MTRSVWGVLLGSALLTLVSACHPQTNKSIDSAPGPSSQTASDTKAPTHGDCANGQFRGQFEAPDEKPVKFRLHAQSCSDGQLYFEVRGPVGGPRLVSAIGDERVLLMFPSDRRAARGSVESTELWRVETGLAFDARILATLSQSTTSPTQQIGPWNVRRVADSNGRLPRSLTASREDGATMTLRKESERPARRRFAWPEIPSGFAVSDY